MGGHIHPLTIKLMGEIVRRIPKRAEYTDKHISSLEEIKGPTSAHARPTHERRLLGALAVGQEDIKPDGAYHLARSNS